LAANGVARFAGLLLEEDLADRAVPGPPERFLLPALGELGELPG
jgi:hypothetical protein